MSETEKPAGIEEQPERPVTELQRALADAKIVAAEERLQRTGNAGVVRGLILNILAGHRVDRFPPEKQMLEECLRLLQPSLGTNYVPTDPGGAEIRESADGTLDEVVGRGVDAHLEKMDTGHWFLTIGDVAVWLSSSRRISISIERRERPAQQRPVANSDSTLRAVLTELVRLKDIKERLERFQEHRNIARHEADEVEYKAGKEKAWAAARAALAQTRTVAGKEST